MFRSCLKNQIIWLILDSLNKPDSFNCCEHTIFLGPCKIKKNLCNHKSDLWFTFGVLAQNSLFKLVKHITSQNSLFQLEAHFMTQNSLYWLKTHLCDRNLNFMTRNSILWNETYFLKHKTHHLIFINMHTHKH